MNFRAEGWSYLLSEEHHARIDSLIADWQFSGLCQTIEAQLKVLCCHISPLDRNTFEGSSIVRPVYTIEISRPLFDQFFNSVFGYRAAYFISPGTGFDANAHFLQTVARRLIDDPVTSDSGLDPHIIREALESTSSKVWLAENMVMKKECPDCQGEWGIAGNGSAILAELRNSRWEIATSQNAEWGRKAPYHRKLRIMGAFLNQTNPRHEIIPDNKRQRALSIHQNGWS